MLSGIGINFHYVPIFDMIVPIHQVPQFLGAKLLYIKDIEEVRKVDYSSLNEALGQIGMALNGTWDIIGLWGKKEMDLSLARVSRVGLESDQLPICNSFESEPGSQHQGP
jgi:hypothetical protein